MPRRRARASRILQSVPRASTASPVSDDVPNQYALFRPNSRLLQRGVQDLKSDASYARSSADSLTSHVHNIADRSTGAALHLCRTLSPAEWTTPVGPKDGRSIAVIVHQSKHQRARDPLQTLAEDRSPAYVRRYLRADDSREPRQSIRPRRWIFFKGTAGDAAAVRRKGMALVERPLFLNGPPPRFSSL